MKTFVLKLIGLLFVGLAIIGVFLPLLPTTPFLLVSAACFAKSSPRFYQLLINNKLFGSLIVDWRSTRSIPKKAKVIALTSMLIAFIFSFILLEGFYLKLLLITLMIWPINYIARLPIAPRK